MPLLFLQMKNPTSWQHVSQHKRSDKWCNVIMTRNYDIEFLYLGNFLPHSMLMIFLISQISQTQVNKNKSRESHSTASLQKSRQQQNKTIHKTRREKTTNKYDETINNTIVHETINNTIVQESAYSTVEISPLTWKNSNRWKSFNIPNCSK